MMRPTRLVPPLLAAILFSGCSSGPSVTAFGEELRTLTGDMTTLVTANPTNVGVAEAREVFTARKAQLQQTWESLIAANLGEETRSELLRRVVDSRASIRSLISNHLERVHQDPAFSDELTKLIVEFETTFDPERIGS